MNLLPWRNITKQREEQRLYYQLLCAIGITLLIFITLRCLFFYKLAKLQHTQRNLITHNQINSLDVMLRQKQQQLAQLNLTLKQKDDADKATTRYITTVRRIVEALPHQIVLEKIQKIKSEITLTGKTDDAFRIHQYTARLTKALPKQKVTLLEIAAYENHHIRFLINIL